MKLVLFALWTLLLLPGAVHAEAGFGVAIGAEAPDFTLVDQNGKEQRLSALRKRGPVAILFYRSGDW